MNIGDDSGQSGQVCDSGRAALRARPNALQIAGEEVALTQYRLKWSWLTTLRVDPDAQQTAVQLAPTPSVYTSIRNDPQ